MIRHGFPSYQGSAHSRELLQYNEQPMQSTSSNRITFEAIGTQWDIEFLQETTSVELESLRIAILKRIETFDHTYSRFRDDSLLMQLADCRFPRTLSHFLAFIKNSSKQPMAR